MRKAFCCILFFVALEVRAFDFKLPTLNDALFSEEPEKFYMHVNRFRDGKNLKPWTGGQFGFVRTPRETEHGEIFTRFHEGIDIAPLWRSFTNKPLDHVRAAAPGHVVYSNDSPHASNYGRYMVLEHDWNGAPVYTLYAHLHELFLQEGAEVDQGQPIARMGYSGRGLSLARAHLHFETGLLLNTEFESWFADTFPDRKNWHGIYSGINLSGLDAARLLKNFHNGKGGTLKEFFAGERVWFTVSTPETAAPDLLERYPFLSDGVTDFPNGMKIHFSQWGLPLKIEALDAAPTELAVEVLPQTPHSHVSLSRGLVRGANGEAALTSRGERLLKLITWHAPEGEDDEDREAREVEEPEEPQKAKTYTIRSGDTLAEVAKRFDVEVKALQEHNQIEDPRKLQIGQVLEIPDVE